MNVIVRRQVSLAEFLAWEREQPESYEFDGTQPVLMNGGTLGHARMIAKVVDALRTRLTPDYEVFGSSIKVRTKPDRVRYPDVLVLRRGQSSDLDIIEPVVVFEVLSPSTAMTDLRVKPDEYALTPSIMAYVILPADGNDNLARHMLVLRRSNDWEAEHIGASLDLPEIGVSIPNDVLIG